MNQQTLATMSPQELLAPGLRALESALNKTEEPVVQRAELEKTIETKSRIEAASQKEHPSATTKTQSINNSLLYFSSAQFFLI